MSRPHRPTRAHVSRRPSAVAPAIQRITKVCRALELEVRLERRSQATILSAIREQNGGDVPPGESYRLLAIRRESVINPSCGVMQERKVGVT